MIRDIEKTLIEWKNNNRRRPILLRGARQVGKSYTVRAFGQKYFKNIIEIDFELNPKFINCFSSLEPHEINQKISVLTQQDITAGDTLLFFDEIQKCPAAIKALRYYFEKMPGLHVIGAGSLLELIIGFENLEMPVGRIQYMYMHPMSFGEFCTALGEQRMRDLLSNQKFDNTIDDAMHNHALDLLKKYYVIGGMPAVIDEYIATGDIMQCQRIQEAIIQTYRDDFGKYANIVKHKFLQKVFDAIPRMVGEKFKYSKVDNDIPSRELKEALELLERAGIMHKVKATSGEGLPLEAGIKERHFKTIFLDIGLMQNVCGYRGDILQTNDILAIHRGAVAEQFVGQELVATTDSYTKAGLYYWIREAKSSNAEVDYLITKGSKVIPLEVKSGPKGKLRSLSLFMKQYCSIQGIVVSQEKYSMQENVIFIPLYALAWLQNASQ